MTTWGRRERSRCCLVAVSVSHLVHSSAAQSFAVELVVSQWATRASEVYGPNDVETHPEAEVLKREIYHIFDTKTKRTAQKRYDKVMALRKRYMQKTPARDGRKFRLTKSVICSIINIKYKSSIRHR